VNSRRARVGLAVALALAVIGGAVVAVRAASEGGRTYVTAYFANSNGTYVGDHVLILGVPVGEIEKVEPQPERVKIVFWYRDKYKVPADAKAVVVSPTLVTARSIQLSPVYTGGAFLPDHAVIPQDRTAVPMEWDDLRKQLDKLTQTLQPTKPGGVSTLGQFINTAAENLRGQGPDIRASIVKLSQAISAIADHSGDFFSTLKSLATLVSALRDSSGLLRQLNQNLAAVTGLVANDPNEVANAVRNLNDVVDDVRTFVATNRESLGTTSDKLASVSRAVTESLDDVKQTLHIAPTTFQNFLNIYQPAQGTLTGIVGLNNFANTIQFLCGAVQAASRLGNEQSAKLCAQYLAPIMKNRQYNFLPMGLNPFVGTSARPNEITYSQDWLRPDYVPPPANTPPPAGQPQPVEINPASGLSGMMTPPGGGQ
jgi:phospholipid/cholesterol/gamma-HCH transport system substrate-binding protein